MNVEQRFSSLTLPAQTVNSASLRPTQNSLISSAPLSLLLSTKVRLLSHWRAFSWSRVNICIFSAPHDGEVVCRQLHKCQDWQDVLLTAWAVRFRCSSNVKFSSFYGLVSHRPSIWNCKEYCLGIPHYCFPICSDSVKQWIVQCYMMRIPLSISFSTFQSLHLVIILWMICFFIYRSCY